VSGIKEGIMKKLFLVFLVLSIGLFLFACGEPDPEPEWPAFYMEMEVIDPPEKIDNYWFTRAKGLNEREMLVYVPAGTFHIDERVYTNHLERDRYYILENMGLLEGWKRRIVSLDELEKIFKWPNG
jgi:hypothetical protein